MHLRQARLVGTGPIADLTFRFAEDDRPARRTTVVLGGGGTGKTSLLAAIASTRPGYAVALPKARGAVVRAEGGGPFAALEWGLGDDDPARPHPLVVASPNAMLEGEREEVAAARRREQAIFERRATERGFAFLAFSAARWFSRAPVLLSSPERTVGRYDVRAPASFDDPTRADLARETKTVLAYAAIAAALAREASGASTGGSAAERLERGVKGAVAPLARLGGVAWTGVDPVTLEPLFESVATGALSSFDDLPQSVRHLVAFGALTARVLFAAHPEADPRACEGVALIDDADLHQDAPTQRALVPALREALPHVQWIVASSQPAIALACAPSEVLALRRLPDEADVRLYEGEQALVH